MSVQPCFDIALPTIAAQAEKVRLFSGCELCRLQYTCRRPKLEPTGSFGKKIMIVLEIPSWEDDHTGQHLSGAMGLGVRHELARRGVDAGSDCVATSVIQCRPADGVFPKDKATVEYCSSRVRAQIAVYKPSLIMAFGYYAASAVLQLPDQCTMRKLRGRVVPSQEHNCWVSCVYSPEFVQETQSADYARVWSKDIGDGLSYLDKPLPRPLDPNKFTIYRDADEAIRMMRWMGRHASAKAIDYETNAISPWAENAKLLTISFSSSTDHGHVVPLDYPGVWTPRQRERVFAELKAFMQSRSPKVIHNRDFEAAWTKVHLGVEIRGEIWDTMISNHVGDERSGVNSMDFMTWCLVGQSYKGMVDVANLENTPLVLVCQYNALDTRYELWQYERQQELFDKPTKRASRFFNAHVRVLTNMRIRGMRVDLPELDSFEKENGEYIQNLDQQIGQHAVTKACEDYTKTPFNPSSEQQVRRLLYDLLRYAPPEHRTERDELPTDKMAIDWCMQQERDSTVKQFFELLGEHSLHSKLQSTYVTGLRKHLTGDLLHPNFLLHTTETYRSSSMDPNFQNFPKRNKMQMKVRRIFVPKYDWLVEVDFRGAEIAVMAMCSRDKRLIEQILAKVDIHRYWAARVYGVPEDKVTKDQRGTTKNKFLFPLFYGSTVASIARNLNMDPMAVQNLVSVFWAEYPGVRDYQLRTYDRYEEQYCIETRLGFRRRAPLPKTAQINSEIQGTSFHLLLASLQHFDITTERLKMQSGLIVEIHDSGMADVVDSELEDVVKHLHSSFTRQHFAWQKGVPMEIEYSVGRNWYEMVDI